jgi:hypothetical protein
MRPYAVTAFVAFSIVLASAPLRAQAASSPARTRWTIALGPSETVGAGNPIWTADGNEALVGPAGNGFHVAVGAARAIPRSSLEFQAHILYNRVAGGHATYLAVDYGSGLARMAHRAESFALISGLTWRAFADRRWTPYLVTAAGIYRSILGTNPDDRDARVSETYAVTNPGVNAGVGIALRFGTREGFFEVRRHELLGVSQGVSYVPLSFGMRF